MKKLAEMGDEYKGYKVERVNENYFKTNTIVKYCINVKGVPVYFKTQKDLKTFIDKGGNDELQF